MISIRVALSQGVGAWASGATVSRYGRVPLLSKTGGIKSLHFLCDRVNQPGPKLSFLTPKHLFRKVLKSLL